MSVETVIYLVQILILSFCILPLAFCLYMVHRSRSALNGLHRGLLLMIGMLIALIGLLILRRVDDAFDVFDVRATLALSSCVMLLIGAIVLIVTMDLHFIYRNRDLYAMFAANRRKRIEELETLRQKNERINNVWGP